MIEWVNGPAENEWMMSVRFRSLVQFGCTAQRSCDPRLCHWYGERVKFSEILVAPAPVSARPGPVWSGLVWSGPARPRSGPVPVPPRAACDVFAASTVAAVVAGRWRSLITSLMRVGSHAFGPCSRSATHKRYATSASGLCVLLLQLVDQGPQEWLLHKDN